MLVRMEDTDQTRCKLEYEAAIIRDLHWAGITYELPIIRQSERMPLYIKALEKLERLGLTYKCFKTRSQINAEIAQNPKLGNAYKSDHQFLPEGEIRFRLDTGEAYATRLSIDRCLEHLGSMAHNLTYYEEIDGELFTAKLKPYAMGDAVLGRKEFPASYHLAGIIDDAAQGVTHVIRGADLAQQAHLQVLIQTVLRLPTPIYAHHAVLTDAQGKRFSKSDQSKTVRAYREEGYTPAGLRDTARLWPYQTHQI